jgi:hypothetical protein
MPRILQPVAFNQGLKAALIGLVLTAVAVGISCYWGHHVLTALKGPTAVTLADIAKMKDPSDLPSAWVKFPIEKYAKSNVYLEEVRSGVSSVDEEYIVFEAGDRWMIASVPADFNGHELSGQFWESNSPLIKEVLAAVAEDTKEVHQGKLYPLEFDMASNYGTEWLSFAGVVAMVGGGGLLFSFIGLGGVFRSFRPGDEMYQSDDETESSDVLVDDERPWNR